MNSFYKTSLAKKECSNKLFCDKKKADQLSSKKTRSLAKKVYYTLYKPPKEV